MSPIFEYNFGILWWINNEKIYIKLYMNIFWEHKKILKN